MAMLDECGAGELTHVDKLVMSGNANQLGMPFLCRHVVTFDFPHAKLFLRRGASFDSRDTELEALRIGLERMEHRVRITHIREDSPAWRQGLRKDDLIESINGRRAESCSLMHVKRLLTRDGQFPDLEFRRGDREHSVHDGESSPK